MLARRGYSRDGKKGNRKILAMKAAGMSVASIARPVFLLALLGCVLSAGFNNEIGPRNTWAYRDNPANSLEEDPLQISSRPVLSAIFPAASFLSRSRHLRRFIRKHTVFCHHRRTSGPEGTRPRRDWH